MAGKLGSRSRFPRRSSKGDEVAKPIERAKAKGSDTQEVFGVGAGVLIGQVTYDACVENARRQFAEQYGKSVHDASEPELADYGRMLRQRCTENGARIPEGVKF